jgi:hypothetical protein
LPAEKDYLHVWILANLLDGLRGINPLDSQGLLLGTRKIDCASAFEEAGSLLFKPILLTRAVKSLASHRQRDIKQPSAIRLQRRMHPAFKDSDALDT